MHGPTFAASDFAPPKPPTLACDRCAQCYPASVCVNIWAPCDRCGQTGVLSSVAGKPREPGSAAELAEQVVPRIVEPPPATDDDVRDLFGPAKMSPHEGNAADRKTGQASAATGGAAPEKKSATGGQTGALPRTFRDYLLCRAAHYNELADDARREQIDAQRRGEVASRERHALRATRFGALALAYEDALEHFDAEASAGAPNDQPTSPAGPLTSDARSDDDVCPFCFEPRSSPPCIDPEEHR